MTVVLKKIAFFQNRHDQVPNQELAKELVRTKNTKGIAEIAENLWNKENKNIPSDCLKVLYEIGYISPELIAEHVDDFLRLLTSKNNRIVWGGMIALGTIADLKSKEIGEHIDEVIHTMELGSLITVVWGVKTLSKVAAKQEQYKKKIFPVLLKQLNSCLARDIPMHLESILPILDEKNKTKFLAMVESRRKEMTPAQLNRLKKVLKKK
jgi:hypothetical protein